MSAVEIRNVVHKVSDHFWSHTTVFAGFLALKFGALVDASESMKLSESATQSGGDWSGAFFSTAPAIAPVVVYCSGGFWEMFFPPFLSCLEATFNSCRWNNVWCLGMISLGPEKISSLLLDGTFPSELRISDGSGLKDLQAVPICFIVL